MTDIPLPPTPLERAWRTFKQTVVAVGIFVPAAVAAITAAGFAVPSGAALVALSGLAVVLVSLAQNAWEQSKLLP